MGLDMYANVTAEKLDTDVDFTSSANHNIHYWRKHPDLHGWMRDLYRAKGGRDADFNCSNLRLTLEDLDALEQAVRGDALPATSGLFFGASDGSEREDDLAFIAKARGAIAAGLTVFYSAWW